MATGKEGEKNLSKFSQLSSRRGNTAKVLFQNEFRQRQSSKKRPSTDGKYEF